jgi:mannosyltransferase
MIFFDEIVSDINGAGGVSVVFNELQNYLKLEACPYLRVGYSGEVDVMLKRRVLERYRDVDCAEINENGIFHSTYYRLPHNKSIPVVTTVHDFTYEKMIGGLPAMVHKWQKYRAIRAADRIVCVSNNTATDLMRYVPDVDLRKVVIIPNGVSEKFTFKSNILDFENYVLFVGSRVRYKNFLNAVKAASRVEGLRLICVGGGEFTTREKIFLNEYLGSNRYEHAGYVTTDELCSYYRKAFALIYSSLYEGFGIPVLEAFRCGCPVVAVDCSSIPEVSGGYASLAASGDASELHKALIAIKDKEYRNDLVCGGLDYSMKFSWGNTGKSMLEVYNSI